MFEHLLSPLQVGRFTVRSRVLITPHATGYVDENSIPDERAVYYYAERAKGGVGLMSTGASSVHPTSPRVTGVGTAYDRRTVEAWRKIADAVHANGGRMMVMLTHMGRVSRSSDLSPLLAPSPMIDGNYHQAVPHELDPEDIPELVAAFASSAALVKESGMDGVYIQGAHGYLITQFLSPWTNHRTDAYGGGLDGRMRFCLEVVDAVRRAVGTDYTVGIRLTADELVPGGLTLPESSEIVRRLDRTGHLDFFDISGGTDGDLMSVAHHIPSMYVPSGNLVHLAAAIKQVTTKPVFCVGGIRDPYLAEHIVKSGQADMVGMTRANIADPHLVAKLREGRLEDIRSCVGAVQGCVGALMQGTAISCVYNPVTGREKEWGTIEPAAQPKRVVVVGGGPAGMEAARVAAERGHKVILFEADVKLGGQLLLAARLPKRENFQEAIRFLSTQVHKLGVDVRLGQAVDADDVKAESPDAVVLATGASPELPQLPGANGQLVHAADVIALRANVGERVLVVDADGHLRGCGTADWLATRGKKVTITSEQLYVGKDIDNKTLYALQRRLREQGVKMIPSTRFEGWDGGTAIVSDIFTHVRRPIPDVDTVVWAAPGHANDELVVPLREAGLDVHAIGDCVAPRRLESAVREGHTIGRGL